MTRLATMIVLLTLVSGLVPLAQTPQTPAAPDDTARINAWFETKFEEQLAFSPIQQTFLGRKSERHRRHVAGRSGPAAGVAARLGGGDEEVVQLRTLSPEAQTSYDLWIYQLEQAEAALPFRTNAYIFNQMSAIHTFLPQLVIAFHQVETRPTWRPTSIASASPAGRSAS